MSIIQVNKEGKYIIRDGIKPLSEEEAFPKKVKGKVKFTYSETKEICEAMNFVEIKLKNYKFKK